MPKKKVLYVCHNHPALHPGGAETYALELHEAMRASSEFEPIFLARAAALASPERPHHPGTPFGVAEGDPTQYFVFTDAPAFDFFYLTSRDKDLYTRHFHEFLLAHRPDLVHMQHTLFLGFDLLRQIRNTLPDVPIVYTLHEYLPICHRDGQMVRTRNDELCREASPRRCHECFPNLSPQDFFMRKRFIQAHLQLVDLFLAPSRFLLERFAEWGLPRQKLRYEEYGRRSARRVAEAREERPRNRFGFFGQLSAYKGVNVLLRAMKLLGEDGGRGPSRALHGSAPGAERPEARLWIHGANLEFQPGSFRSELSSLLAATGRNVTFAGPYVRAELPRLMAGIDWVVVPSIWWENSPLVIQEAFLHGRPVICSDVGAMAEKVAHGRNGLHFRVGDPASLADALRTAAATPGLWETLRSGIPEVYRMEHHVAALAEIYRSLLGRSAAAPARVEEAKYA